MKYLSAIALCFCIMSAAAQTPVLSTPGPTEVKPAIDTSANPPAPDVPATPGPTAEQTLAEIKNELAQIKKIVGENDKDETVKVAYIELNTKEITVHQSHTDKESNPKPATITVDSAFMRTEDGCIISITVIGKDGTRFVSKAPIGLTYKRIAKKDRLFCLSCENGEYILVTDLFKFTFYQPYIGKNDFVCFTPNSPGYTLYKEIGLNSIVDLRLYTDALATFGGESNGLIQTEASFKQPLNRYNVKNSGCFFARYGKINVVASKFDSKLGYTDSAAFSRSSLMQKSWLTADISLNMVNWWLSKGGYNKFFLDFGIGMNLSNLATPRDTMTITSSFIFLHPGFDIRAGDNIGATFSMKFLWSYSPQTDFNQQDIEHRFIRPGVGVFWNPAGNEASRIFFRGEYCVDPREKKNHFFTMQFGYSLRLTSLAK